MKSSIHRTIQNLSLGFRTEMIFHQFDGVVKDYKDYLVVKTPLNPGFMFGNLLLFYKAPTTGTLEKWKTLFKKEFQDLPEVKHITFLWDSPSEGPGDTSELSAAGFKVDFSIVLTAQSVHQPVKFNSEMEVRKIETDKEWKDVTEAQILSKSNEYDEKSYRLFKESQMNRYREMSIQGLGNWFGAFANGQLVGDLGLFRENDVGRFQSVETHPDYRRQGICGTLVYESAKFGFNSMNLKELVMVADENYHAAKIYESVGFKPKYKEYSAFWWDKNEVSN